MCYEVEDTYRLSKSKLDTYSCIAIDLDALGCIFILVVYDVYGNYRIFDMFNYTYVQNNSNL